MPTLNELRRVAIDTAYGGSYPDWIVNPPDPTLTSLNPNSITAGDPPVAVTLTGTNFTPASKVVVDGAQQLTQYVSPTTLRYAAEATSAGDQDVEVHNGPTQTSEVVVLLVTAPAGVFNPFDHTIAEVQTWVTDHPDERDAITDMEIQGKARVTLLEWLAAFDPGA